MAYSTLADFIWGSHPRIPLKFEYDRRRAGTAMEYKIKVTVKPMASSEGSFGFKIGTKIVLAGTTVIDDDDFFKGNSPSTWNSNLVYESSWQTVANKTSGTTPLSITILTNAGRGNASYSYNLTVDPGKSTMTVPTFTIGTAGSFAISRNSSNFTHTITYAFGTATGTIASKTSSTSVSWTPPLALYNQIVGKTGGKGTVKLETFSGNTSLGSNTYTLTINGTAAYNAPTLTNFSYERGEYSGGTWTVDNNGADLKLIFSTEISAISGNTTTMLVKLGDTVVFNGAASSGEKVFYVEDIGIDNSYSATVDISDTIGATKKYKLSIPSTEVPFNKNFDLPGFAFGKIAEREKTVEISPNWSLRFGTPLYSGGATSGDIQLSETSANFRFIEILYRDNDSRNGSVKIANYGAAANAELSIISPRANGTVTIKSRGIKIDGDTITTNANDGNYSAEVAGIGATAAASSTNHIYIYQVIGWR